MNPQELLDTSHVESPETEQTVYEFFKWSVVLKGLISLAELIVGLALLILPTNIVTWGISLVTSLLSGFSSHAFVAHLLEQLASYGGTAIIYAAFFLLFRGFVKCILIAALLKRQMWSFPASLIFMGLLVIYQLYEIGVAHSILIIGITIFDVIVLYFIWREWRIAKRHQLAPTAVV